MEKHWQRSVDIAASPETVYAYLADFQRHCEWAQTFDRMEASGPEGVGARYRTYERQAMQSDRVPKGPVATKGFKGTTECEVTELKPNERIAWKAHPVPMGMGVHSAMHFDIAPSANGGSTLTQTIDMHQPWLLFQIFTRLIFRMKPTDFESKGEAQWQASLQNIKHILEAPAA
jgi:uncharacterized protein YndB with AHSA1/START domain